MRLTSLGKDFAHTIAPLCNNLREAPGACEVGLLIALQLQDKYRTEVRNIRNTGQKYRTDIQDRNTGQNSINTGQKYRTEYRTEIQDRSTGQNSRNTGQKYRTEIQDRMQDRNT